MSCIFCTDQGICLLRKSNCTPEDCLNPFDIGNFEEENKE